MSEHTAISWCDSTFNPWVGCTKVSPACDHCYAERLMDHRMHKVQWGAGQQRKRTSAGNWQQPLAWERAAWRFVQCADCGRRGPAIVSNGTTRCGSCDSQATTPARRRVFCASLADVFDNEVDPAWRADLFDLIANTPHLDWLLLTKRIGNADAMMRRALQDDGPDLPWPNLWLGATVVNQEEADRDIPKLLAVPARVRFLSIEPMLGEIDLTRLVLHSGPLDVLPTAPPEWRGVKTVNIVTNALRHGKKSGTRIDWVICGGESGPNARPMYPDWVRSLRDQCADAGVPFHFKQWGEWTPGENVERVRGTVDTAFLWDDGWHVWPLNLATDPGHIDDQPDLYRVGTKAAGRHIDGIEHNGVPS